MARLTQHGRSRQSEQRARGVEMRKAVCGHWSGLYGKKEEVVLEGFWVPGLKREKEEQSQGKRGGIEKQLQLGV